MLFIPFTIEFIFPFGLRYGLALLILFTATSYACFVPTEIARDAEADSFVRDDDDEVFGGLPFDEWFEVVDVWVGRPALLLYGAGELTGEREAVSFKSAAFKSAAFKSATAGV